MTIDMTQYEGLTLGENPQVAERIPDPRDTFANLRVDDTEVRMKTVKLSLFGPNPEQKMVRPYSVFSLGFVHGEVPGLPVWAASLTKLFQLFEETTGPNTMISYFAHGKRTTRGGYEASLQK